MILFSDRDQIEQRGAARLIRELANTFPAHAKNALSQLKKGHSVESVGYQLAMQFQEDIRQCQRAMQVSYQQRDAAQWENWCLQTEIEALKQENDLLHAHPLRQQLRDAQVRLQHEMETACTLKNDLQNQARAHAAWREGTEQEIQQLRATLAELERIVAQQQLRLNDAQSSTSKVFHKSMP
jgi:hypothetical protein